MIELFLAAAFAADAAPPPRTAWYVSPRIGASYFRIEANPPAGSAGEPCWRLIVDSAKVGVYVPAAVPDAQLELAVVIEA